MDELTETQALIAEECALLRDLLIAKNRAYGNSALEPVRVFSRASTEEQIRVRLDDKLSRLARGHAAGEDTELDILGYLVLLRVHRKIREREERAKLADLTGKHGEPRDRLAEIGLGAMGRGLMELDRAASSR